MQIKSNAIGKIDLLKSIDDLTTPDSRWEIFSDNYSLEIFHKQISEISIHEKAPLVIKENFETAKNTLLYAYFSYRLSTPALSFALASLEHALSEKFKNDGVRMPNGLNNKLKRALDLGWLRADQVVQPHHQLSDWHHYIKTAIIPFIVHLRNNLAHEPQLLYLPHQACEHMRMISQIVNMLY